MLKWVQDEDNLWTYLVGDIAPAKLKEIYLTLRVRAKNYVFDPRYQAGVWDGYEYFFNASNRRILTGLTGFAIKTGLNYPVENRAKAPQVFTEELPYLNKIPAFTNYQKEALLTLSKGLIHRGVFDHCTGAGKTVLMAAIVRSLDQLQTVITVPSTGLLFQTHQELEQMLEEKVGMFGAKRKLNPEARVLIFFDRYIKDNLHDPWIQEVASRCQLLISDELQMVTSRLYPFYMMCTSAYYRFGFSGSFYNNDAVKVISTTGHFGDTISTVTDRDLIEEKRSVPPVFLFYEFLLTKPIPEESYQECYSRLIVGNDYYNDYFIDDVLRQLYDQGKTILILVKYKNHLQVVSDKLASRSIEHEVYSGDVHQETRKKLRQNFQAGSLSVLIATEQTFSVGINIPRMDVLINLGGGLSDDKTIQKYGRVLRSFEGKEAAIVIEPFFTNNRWFAKHSKARMKIALSYSTGSVYKFPYKSKEATLVVSA